MKCTLCGYVNLDNTYYKDNNGMYAICLECDEKIDIRLTPGKYRIECCEQMQLPHTVTMGVICETKAELLQTYLKMYEEHKCSLCNIYDKHNDLVFQGLLSSSNYKKVENLI